MEPNGNELSAAEILERHRTPGYAVQSLRHENVRVRLSGDCAIVTAESALEASYRDLDVSGRYPYVRVWQRQDPGWRVLVTVGFPARKPEAD